MPAQRPQLFTANARFAINAPAAGKTGPGTLTGYAMLWNSPSSDRGGYQVNLLPNSAKFAKPTLALFHHDYRHVLGNTENGTLRLTSDQVGVKFEIDLPDTQAGRDVATLVRDKYVAGMSFAMTEMPSGNSRTIDNKTILDVAEFTADEITVTAIPSFDSTSVEVATPQQQQSPRLAASRERHAQQRDQLARLQLDSINLPGA